MLASGRAVTIRGSGEEPPSTGPGVRSVRQKLYIHSDLAACQLFLDYCTPVRFSNGEEVFVP